MLHVETVVIMLSSLNGAVTSKNAPKRAVEIEIFGHRTQPVIETSQLICNAVNDLVS
jgi:hypothetical protein